MSTREKAINLVNRLNDKRLEILIELFEQFADEKPDEDEDEDEDLRRKREAFMRLQKIIQNSSPMNIEDYDKELAEYREEKYGN